MRSAASQGRAGRRAERRDRWDALSSSRPFLSTRECRRVASARRRRRCSRAKAARTRKQARQAVRSEVGQGSWPGSLAVRLAEGTRARDEAAIPALRVGVHGAGNGWDENRRPLDVIAKTSESGAAMVGCPRYLYFYIRPGCLPPQSPAVSSSRQAACLVRPPPSRKGMETVSTLGQGAESSWATPKGRYAWAKTGQADDGCFADDGWARWQDARQDGRLIPLDGRRGSGLQGGSPGLGPSETSPSVS